MKLFKIIKDLRPSIDTTTEQGLQYFRQRLLYYLLLSGLLFGFIAYLPSVYFAYKFNLYGIIFIDTSALGFTVFIFFNKFLNFTQKAICLLFIFYLLGLLLLIAVGPLGAGFLWLFFFSVMTGVLLGTKPAFIALGLNALSFVLLGFFINQDQLSWTQSFSDPLSIWIIIGVNFLCLNTVVSISVSILLKKLNVIFNQEKKNSSELKHEVQARIQAEKENERLANQILQAQKMEALGTLAGGVAHDFNNILSTILGNAELALMDLEQSDSRYKKLENICTASDRAKGIISQILMFSRQSSSDKIPCNMKTIVRDCTKLFKVGIPDNIEFSCTIKTDHEVILANQTQIYQVIMNLCTNAMHAIEDKKGKISIFLEKKDITSDDDMSKILNSGDFFELCIEDTGHGIERKNIARIFEPYFTTKEISKGTGMGLAIAHGIIKDHGGEIIVSSKADIGTRFIIYLPVHKPQQVKPLSDLTPQYKGKEKILYVDDEETLLKVSQLYLKKLGYTVQSQTDPVDALKTFSSDPDSFDLVVTDEKMPHMTGEQLSNEIRKIRPDIPIILSSGVGGTTEDNKFDETLIKPVKGIILAQTIRKVLDKRIKANGNKKNR